MDIAVARPSLVRAFRSGQGATDALAAEAVGVLGQSWAKTFEDLAADELLSELLRGFPVFPAWLERRMTALRRRYLFGDSEGGARLLADLAIQCHLNEYAWAEDATEALLVDRFIDSLADLTPDQVMALACYRPLARIPGADALLAKGWTGPVEAVLREQIATVREEQAIQATIPTLTPIRTGTSEAVRSQYEENPYPRWRRAGIVPVQMDIVGRPIPPEPTVLIAGCGTGRQAIQATLAIRGSRTLAIDLSRASLAYAIRKTRELGVEGIEYAQADILELAASGRTFDIVQCAGVLHHMSDPFEGARAVARMTKPGGFLALGLYSAQARVGLRPAKALGKRFTPQTVREFRQAIMAAPEGDPVRAPALSSRDFYATSGCRDLLMHVQEHELEIADLRQMLDENGLTFLGFHQFGLVKDAYLAMFPHDPAGVDLDAWSAFETAHPSTFSRMYQFWAAKPG